MAIFKSYIIVRGRYFQGAFFLCEKIAELVFESAMPFEVF